MHTIDKIHVSFFFVVVSRIASCENDSDDDLYFRHVLYDIYFNIACLTTRNKLILLNM